MTMLRLAEIKPLYLSAHGVLLLSVIGLLSSPFLLRSYDYPHAWVSAHHAIIGQNSPDQGILQLGATPLQNFIPSTTQFDYYVNWPPLYTIGLSLVFRIFGESEFTHHSYAVVINLAIAGVLFQFVRRSCGLLLTSLWGY